MSNLSTVQNQACNIIPARTDGVLPIGVTTTSQSYNMQLPSMLGSVYAADKARDALYLTLQADGADVYYKFGPAAVTLVPATVVAAGTTLTASTSGSSFQGAASAAYCMKIPSNTSIDVRIQRGTDVFLNIIGSAAGTLRLCFSSQAVQQ